MRPHAADTRSRLRSALRPRMGLGLVLAALATLSVGAALRTSTTFDEIVLVGAGARALETGSWSMVVDQPPLMPLLYGLPFQAVDARFPSEVRERGFTWDDRWEYARSFFFRVGNDPRRVALQARLVAVGLALGLVVVTYLYGAWMAGAAAGLMGAFLVAFTPDVVAHGAVAYNDLPLALAWLAAVWALDAAVRRPGVGTGALAGVAVALALGVKFSALALGPVAVVLVVLEGAGREGAERRGWVPKVALASLAGLVAAWVALALLYRGDWYLVRMEYGIRFTIEHAAGGHPAPAWLFGATSPDGWWYWFPVALVVKTPAAMALLAPLAGVGAWLAGRASRRRSRSGERLRALLRSRARGPAVAVAVFGGFLLASNLNVGFRYALPALPPLLLLVAVGLGRLWTMTGTWRRAALVVLLVLHAGSTVSAYPWFLSYESEWFRGRPPGQEALLDSSRDWGQGLLALREWMDDEEVATVRLSYFGSALPAAYGIRYEALPSFLRLPPGGEEGSVPPRWTVISATNLHGLYLEGDPFARYRSRSPDRVLAGSLYLYREGGGG